MGLFISRICPICKKKIRMFDSVKLSDGYICKNCFKHNPDFSSDNMNHGKDNSSINDDTGEKREKRKSPLEGYNFDRRIVGLSIILVDESKGAFVIDSQSNRGWLVRLIPKKPVVMLFKDVAKITPKIETSESEITYSWGRSYIPRVYSETFTFSIEVKFNNNIGHDLVIDLFEVNQDIQELVQDDDDTLLYTLFDKFFKRKPCKEFIGRRDNYFELLESEEYYDTNQRLNDAVEYLRSRVPGYQGDSADNSQDNLKYKKHVISSAQACKFAFFGFLLSIASYFCCAILSPISLVLSLIGLFASRKYEVRAKVYSVIGIVLSIVQIALVIWFILIFQRA